MVRYLPGNPQSLTFNSWTSSLQKAQAGTLGTGTHRTGVVDKPGILLGKEGSFKRRTLRFRISAGDASGPVFKGDAIQVLRVEDGKLKASFYQDSTGTTLKGGEEEESGVMRYRSKVDVEVRREGKRRLHKSCTRLQGWLQGVRQPRTSPGDRGNKSHRATTHNRSQGTQ